MLKLFRSQNPYTVISLFGVAICFKLSYLIHPMLLFVPHQQYIWSRFMEMLQYILGFSSFGFTFLAIINIVGQALYLNKIADQFHLFPKNTYLPALGFIIVTSFFPQWNHFSAFLISNWFILAAFEGILKLYAQHKPEKLLFNIGCLIMLSVFLVSSDVFFILLFFVGLGLLRPFNIKEWLISILGLLTPIYFLIAVLFLIDKLFIFPKIFHIGLPQTTIQEITINEYIAFSALLIVLALGIYFVNAHSEKTLIQIKKSWGLVISALIISFAVRFFNALDSFSAWLPAMLPLSLIFTNLWVEHRKSWFPKIIFYLFLFTILFIQWIPLG